MVKEYYLISDAAKLVNVESHVLRYWEEELKLPIKRNELGHRYYTQQDVERFKEIKDLKEQGLQLKAIRMILKDGKLSVEIPDSKDNPIKENLPKDTTVKENMLKDPLLRETPVKSEKELPGQQKGLDFEETKAEKARRLQWLLQQMISETLRENNQELCQDIRESVVKEMDYQFRLQEQKEDARELERVKHQDEYYQKLDELLRMRSGRKGAVKKQEKKEKKEEKRKRHSIF